MIDWPRYNLHHLPNNFQIDRRPALAGRRQSETMMENLATCVHPEGRFVWTVHQPGFKVANLRQEDYPLPIGYLQGRPILNQANFPPGDVEVPRADWIYEIRNPFSFKGATYIGKRWADLRAAKPERIHIDSAQQVSFHTCLEKALGRQLSADLLPRIYALLPAPVKLALATTSTDSRDLALLAEQTCRFHRQGPDLPPEVLACNNDGKPDIGDHLLFEALANNAHLPDQYKLAMVLRPGVQGNSPIVGEFKDGSSHIFEYLRANSYIPWGHYAANMAHDSIRYSIGSLKPADMLGMRHLYYQRTYLRLAQVLNLESEQTRIRRRSLTADELERLQEKIHRRLESPHKAAGLPFKATLWGWNYGFDFAPSGYRLHASHQQIHQQYAMVPVSATGHGPECYCCGELIQRFVGNYRQQTGKAFFETYFQAIASNRRTDGRDDLPADLVVHADSQVMLVVPKAQTSQWELNLICRRQVGHIAEADASARSSLDKGLFLAMQILAAMGAQMITVLEYSRPFRAQDHDQRLMYVFLPRLPQSPGAFSEAQLRWINGHYPEDFARACRRRIGPALEKWERDTGEKIKNDN